MKDYTGKKVFLGIDVHKKTYSITAICEGIVVKKITLQANSEGLLGFCKKFFPAAQIESAYEAGFCGFSLHRTLVQNGINNIVIHASGLEVAAGDRVKTDKRDSLKLAVQLAAGRLKGIHVPSIDREEKRALTRIRDTIGEHKSTIANQIKSFLHYHGHITPNTEKKICPKFIKGLRLLSMPTGTRYALDQLINLWEQLAEKIKEIDAKMVIQASADSILEAVYRSAPGIGPVGARVLANELGDMSQFANERQIFSYTGLTPSEHSSGGHIRKGRISRQGKAVIRKILVLVSWKAIKKDRSLGEIFERIGQRAGAKRAIIGIARRLIGRIRACFRKGSLYIEPGSLATAIA
jgi:transposase